MDELTRELLAKTGLSDYTKFPTDAYALEVYETICRELLPQFSLEIPDEAPNKQIALFARFRKIFAPMGIDLKISDLAAPDSGRLCEHLRKFAAYAQFRHTILEDETSLVNQCAAKLMAVEALGTEKDKLQEAIAKAERELDVDQEKYTQLLLRNEKDKREIAIEYEECRKIAEKAKLMVETVQTKHDELEKVQRTIQEHRKAIATLAPYVDEETGTVKDAKDRVDALREQLRVVKTEQTNLNKQATRLEDACNTVEEIEKQIPGLEEALQAYLNQKLANAVARKQHGELSIETTRKRQQLESLRDTLTTLEERVVSLQKQKIKLENDTATARKKWQEDIDAMKEEEKLLLEQISSEKSKVQSMQSDLKMQRQYNQEVEELLDQAPKKLALADSKLDRVLVEIQNIHVEPPNISH